MGEAPPSKSPSSLKFYLIRTFHDGTVFPFASMKMLAYWGRFSGVQPLLCSMALIISFLNVNSPRASGCNCTNMKMGTSHWKLPQQIMNHGCWRFEPNMLKMLILNIQANPIFAANLYKHSKYQRNFWPHLGIERSKSREYLSILNSVDQPVVSKSTL